MLLMNPVCLTGFSFVVSKQSCKVPMVPPHGIKGPPNELVRYIPSTNCKIFGMQAWKFFSERVAIEEQQLQRFFGNSYKTYAAQTPTLIPFIR